LHGLLGPALAIIGLVVAAVRAGILFARREVLRRMERAERAVST